MYFNKQKMIYRAIKITIICFIVLLSFSSVQAQTQDSYTLLQPLPCISSPAAKDSAGNVIPGSQVDCPQGSGATTKTVDFKTYIQQMFNLFIALAAVLAVFMIVYGGFLYVTTDSFLGKNEGKKKMWDAILGLLLVLCSYFILKIINPQLVEIPDTLVPKLELQKTGDNTMSLLGQIQGEASSYVLQLTDESKKLRSENDTLQKQKDELNNQLIALENVQGKGSGDPEYEKIKAEIANIENKVNSNEGQVYVNIAKANMVSKVSDTIKIADASGVGTFGFDLNKFNATFDDAINFIINKKNESINKLKEVNQNNKEEEIRQEANYQRLKLDNIRTHILIKNAARQPNNDVMQGPTNIGKVDAVKSEYSIKLGSLEKTLSTITDPARKSEMQADIKATRDAFNQKFGK